MEKTRNTLNDLLVELFNYILYIEEKNLKDSGVPLTMNEVHTLESIQKATNNSMTYIARRCMVAQSTLTSNVTKLERKGYALRYKDDRDKRINRVSITEKAVDVLKIHDEFHEKMIDKIMNNMAIGEDRLLMESLENIMDFFREKYQDNTLSE